MALISISERQARSDGTNATVSFDHGAEYPITIKNPFSPGEEEELTWYFEQYVSFADGEEFRAQRVVQSITTYGENLFKQVFADFRVYATYAQYVQAGLNSLQIEIAGSPAFHQLHWESIKDPGLPQPLALQTTMVRKNLIPQSLPAMVRPSPTINLLVVVARPFGASDMGYRTISRPLVEKLRQANVRIEIDILRPGTYRSLHQHLNATSDRYGTGHYHLIHFDTYGTTLTYSQYQQGEKTGYYLCNRRYGRKDIQAFEGTKAFLFLESEQDNKADLVEASELANLLIHHQIPITILNACKSGKQIGTSETSLGSRLIQAGAQLVLAMSYILTVSAAETFIPTLYEQLFAGRDLATSIRYARQELHNRKERKLSFFNQLEEVELEDWLLPVVYQNYPQSLRVLDFTAEEATVYYNRQAERFKPAEPDYGFVGRDLEILQLEKRLLTKRNIVLIRGVGGVGKTSLLQHLGVWWQSTGFVDQVFYFDYRKQLWTGQQIIDIIAQRVLNLAEYYGVFQSLSIDARQAMLIHHLRGHSHLLIVDSLDALIESREAMKSRIPSDEQLAIHSFLADLAGSRTFILLGSREDVNWLARRTFDDNVYDLTGLDSEAVSTLVNNILERFGVKRYRQDIDLRELLKLLKGIPLSLEVELAKLASHKPHQVLSDFQAHLKSNDS